MEAVAATVEAILERSSGASNTVDSPNCMDVEMSGAEVSPQWSVNAKAACIKLVESQIGKIPVFSFYRDDDSGV